MRFVALFLFVCLAGCGKPHRTLVTADEAFQPYIDEFITEADKRGVSFNPDHLIVEFGEVKETDAVCQRGRAAKITVDPGEWETETTWVEENTNRVLIFHELGHCLLGKGHVEHDSVMSFPAVETHEFVGDSEYYIQDLFN